LALTGSEVDAATALDWGLVDAVAPNLYRDPTLLGSD
jgi:enoyl-CoA hydratase/carnithine racemase